MNNRAQEFLDISTGSKIFKPLWEGVNMYIYGPCQAKKSAFKHAHNVQNKIILHIHPGLYFLFLHSVVSNYFFDGSEDPDLGPSCSKLTMSLVNDSLIFTSSDTQICLNFLLKNVSSFCSAKATHIFSAKNFRIVCIESAKTVNEMTLNELVKLMTLWTTEPRLLGCTELILAITVHICPKTCFCIALPVIIWSNL